MTGEQQTDRTLQPCVLDRCDSEEGGFDEMKELKEHLMEDHEWTPYHAHIGAKKVFSRDQ